MLKVLIYSHNFFNKRDISGLNFRIFVKKNRKKTNRIKLKRWQLFPASLAWHHCSKKTEATFSFFSMFA